MSDLILYLSVAVIGYFVGSKLRAKQEITRWTGRIQTFAIIVLIFTMSMSMGSKGEVMEHLNSIGLYAFIMTVVIIFCSVAAITISRKFFKLDKYGNIEGSEVPPEEIAEEEEKAQKGRLYDHHHPDMRRRRTGFRLFRCGQDFFRYGIFRLSGRQSDYRRSLYSVVLCRF